MWKWIGIAIIVVLLLVLAVLLSRIRLKLDIAKHDNDDRAHLEIRFLYGWIKINYDIPAILLASLQKGLLYRLDRNKNIHKTDASIDSGTIDKEKIKLFIHDIRILLKGTRSFHRWIRHTLSHVKMSKMEWSTNISLADAAYTATSTGILWGLKTSLIGFASSFVRMNCTPKLFVVPYWVDRLRFTTTLTCEASISLGYVVYSMLMLAYRIWRVPGGPEAWKRVFSKKPENRQVSSEE
ncbi:hypothetical protein ASL14_23100 [Paenibacillus sp. IHB B 3084]|uniref:DUF2953 domain-containing protein n=1 Tax=unclassified Paenibacillus TaxID=185978 RepID=UPI00072095C0|nr:DUF2953 domain-containing protein [Paenibacillus sp. IHB B 3084]ALP38632.1 hypothetical protein ASL14_23100 [Paenibacillus sp. IHB B 3084]MBE0335928.1 DUF2953 domain-containing protein [Paenibacillus sp. 23TSA30-6]